MERHVGERTEVRRGCGHVECVHMPCGRGDSPEAATLPGAELDRDRGLELGENPLDRGALAGRHLPKAVLEYVRKHCRGLRRAA